MNIYIGDGSKIKSRIRNQHCGGNVEGSSLRKHIALNMGFQLTYIQRKSGNRRVRLDLPNPLIGEQRITGYMRSGLWKFVICPPDINARDFQFYAIQNINQTPILNVNPGKWDASFLNSYQGLLNQLVNCPAQNFVQTENIPNESGVYLFIHDKRPIQFIGSDM
jgi:hypothetical protein